MNNHSDVIKWTTDYLISKKYALQEAPEIVLETPWSNVLRFPTSAGDLYLKQTPPALFLEPRVTQCLANQFHASVPMVIAINDELHCFLMKDAGQSLRKYLKTDFQPALLCESVKHYTNMQRSTENHLASFFALGVPDWRLDKLPKLYNELISQVEILKADGLTDKEVKILETLKSRLSEQCESLSKYQIPATIVQYDFHSNNILYDANTKKITMIDMGEIVITHPFFSLYNFLGQIVKHDAIKEQDQIYYQLQEAWFENWLEFSSNAQLLEVLRLIKELWPIYSVLSAHRLMLSVGEEAFKAYYGNKLAVFFREYIISQNS